GLALMPVITNVGSPLDGFNGANNLVAGNRGQMRVSPQGDKLCVVTFSHNLREILDFDPATGIVSNPLTLPAQTDAPYGVEFSPDGSKLYISYWNTFNVKVDQFDLEDCFPELTETEVGNASFLEPYGALQNAPNGLIYLTAENSFPMDSIYLSTVNLPNWRGVACDFQDSTVLIRGNPNNKGLPNFITSYFLPRFNYRDKCFGEATQFEVTNPFNLSIDSVRWDFGDPGSGALNAADSLNPVHVFTQADTFQVQLIRFIGGQPDTAVLPVVIHPLPAIDLGNDTTLCTGQTLTLQAGFAGPSYHLWQDGSTNTSFTVTAAGTYFVDNCRLQCAFSDTIVVAFDSVAPVFALGPDTNICANDSLVLDPGLPGVFSLWQDTVVASTFTVRDSGLYQVQVSNGCGTANDTILVDLFPVPSVDLGNDTLVCSGNTVTLDPGITGFPLTWQDSSNGLTFTADTTGEYWVRVNTPQCGAVSDTIQVTVSGTGPQFTLGNDTVRCGDSLTLAPNVSLDNYLWDDNSTDSVRTVGSSGIFWLESTNACGTFRDSIVVSSFDVPNFDLGPDTALCPGEVLVIGPAPLPNLTYLWQDGNTNAQRTVSTTGLFRLEVRTPCDTVADSVFISVENILEVDLPDDTTICVDSILVLDATTPGATYLWQDGSIDSTFAVDTSGIYRVTVSRNGCVAADSLRVSEDRFSCIREIDCTVDVPNVFTPNGDGFNDELLVTSSCEFVEFKLTIYNRWGNEVYVTENPNIGWDGRANGLEVPAGAYFWTLDFQHNVVVNLDRLGIRGDLTILR
ncbi:MAG: gliding motility-associated C-terminal domain-containing protein, partial [Bacteroidota bacterium]